MVFRAKRQSDHAFLRHHGSGAAALWLARLLRWQRADLGNRHAVPQSGWHRHAVAGNPAEQRHLPHQGQDSLGLTKRRDDHRKLRSRMLCRRATRFRDENRVRLLPQGSLRESGRPAGFAGRARLDGSAG